MKGNKQEQLSASMNTKRTFRPHIKRQAYLTLFLFLSLSVHSSGTIFAQNTSENTTITENEHTAQQAASLLDGEQKTSNKDTDSIASVSLNIYEYLVSDTSESVSFRLYVQNTTDSLVVIEHVEPSCGCILATVQKSFARPGHDAEIYIGLMTKQMNDWQPFTVDVYTSVNKEKPLRLYIRKEVTELKSNSK